MMGLVDVQEEEHPVAAGTRLKHLQQQAQGQVAPGRPHPHTGCRDPQVQGTAGCGPHWKHQQQLSSRWNPLWQQQRRR